MYCDFYSIANREDAIPDFFKALFNEIKLYKQKPHIDSIDSIFVGGGTPSLIDPGLMEKLFELIASFVDLKQVSEITIEANPGEASLESLNAFQSIGFNRLSLGAQSLNPDLLKFLSRPHGPKQIFETYDNARRAGFKNINCDLIFNIPDQSFTSWKNDLNEMVNIEPDHLSCYSLTVEKGTELYGLVSKGKVSMPQDDDSFQFYDYTQNFLAGNNYSHYEVSNWSKINRECVHNLHYWRIEPYLAFGPSAHGFDGKTRYSNVRSIDGYVESLLNKKLPISFEEKLTKKNITNEILGFGIRMAEGVNLNKIPKSHLDQLKMNIKKNESKWGQFFCKTDKYFSLKSDGMRFADAIAVDLMI